MQIFLLFHGDGWWMTPQCAKDQGRRNRALCWVWHRSHGWKSGCSSAGDDILQLAQAQDLQCDQADNSVNEKSDGGKLCIPVQRNNHQQEGLNSFKAISEGVMDTVGLMAPGGPWWLMLGTLHSEAGIHGATNMRCMEWELPP